MAVITEREAGANVPAFLDMLAFSEGTDNGKQATSDHGYDVLVGGGTFKSYADHPRVLVDLPRYKIKSTAAGRYQELSRNYDAYRALLKLQDFGPLSQDRIAVQQIRECGALPDVVAGRFDEAVRKVRKIWASLPGAGYGQHEQQIDKLRSVFANAGGRLMGAA